MAIKPARIGPKTYEKLSPSSKKARKRALRALSHMRGGQSLARAAKEAETSPTTVRKYSASALERKSGRWTAKKSDRLYRPVLVATTGGRKEVGVRGARQASLVGEHMNAAKRFLKTGDTAALNKFAGKTVGGKALATDPALLEELYRRGELEFEDIYKS